MTSLRGARDRHAGRPTPGRPLLVLGSTVVALLGRDVFHLPDVVMLYLLAILVASFRFGRGPAIAAAALCVATYDFFFVPPFYTFSVEHARHVLTFAMMFGLGLVVSSLTARLRRQEREARVREEHTATLYALSRELARRPRRAPAPREIAARHAAAVFGGAAAVLLRDEDGELAVAGARRPRARGWSRRTWRSPAGRCSTAARPGPGTEILPDAAVACIPLDAGLVPLGVLALLRPLPGVMDVGAPRLPRGLRAPGRVRDRAACASPRRRGRRRCAPAARQMRSSLLSAVSHDLRTPLATITGAGTALRDDRAGSAPEQRAELVDTICTEAERMERLVGNILDMVRIESGGMAPRRDWVPLEEVLGSALAAARRAAPGPRGARRTSPRGSPSCPSTRCSSSRCSSTSSTTP